MRAICRDRTIVDFVNSKDSFDMFDGANGCSARECSDALCLPPVDTASASDSVLIAALSAAFAATGLCAVRWIMDM